MSDCRVVFISSIDVEQSHTLCVGGNDCNFVIVFDSPLH